VREGTGFPLPAGESITVNWPNGTVGEPIPVLDWYMIRPRFFDDPVDSGTLDLPDCTPPTTTTVATTPTTTIGSGAGVPTTTAPVALPETGADTTMLALLASVMLMAGGAAVVVARRTS
jgi:LPXTG-motif cell wall-anchored protein